MKTKETNQPTKLQNMVLTSEEEETAAHVPTPDSPTGELVLAADTTAHGSLPRVRLCPQRRAGPALASDVRADRLTISPYTPAKLCCCLNVPYLQPARKGALSAQHHRPTDLNGSQHPCDHSPPMTARSEDHVYIQERLPGSTCMRCLILLRI